MSNETAGEQTAKTDTDKKGPRDRKEAHREIDSGRREVELGCGDGASNKRQRQQKQKGNSEFPLCDLQYEALLNTLLESK